MAYDATRGFKPDRRRPSSSRERRMAPDWAALLVNAVLFGGVFLLYCYLLWLLLQVAFKTFVE